MRGGPEDIKQHKFFAHIDWTAIERGTVVPDWYENEIQITKF